jgi:HK97 family phage major capsid protein
MSQSWFSIKAQGGEKPLQISIHDEIGFYGVSAKAFIDELSASGNPSEIRLSIHSNGGDVLDGWAIYNALASHPARVVAKIEGLAASMASVIAMAADEVEMPENAFMMIHNATAGVMGDAQEMADMAATLQKVQDGIVTAYSKRTGLSAEEVADLMNHETYLTAAEAVEKGFADTVLKSFKAAACLKHWKGSLPDGLQNKLSFEDSTPPVEPLKPIENTPAKPAKTPAMSEPTTTNEREPQAPSIKDMYAGDKPRRDEIEAIGKNFQLPDEKIKEAIEDGVELDTFRNHVMSNFDPSRLSVTAPEALQDAYTIGNSEAEKFSMFKALRDVSNGGDMTGLEKEVQDELSKKFHAATGEAATGILIPSEWWNKSQSGIQNAATVGTGTSGGNTVDEEMQGMTDYLSDYSILPEIGATIFRDATGNLEFPRSTAGYSGTWDAETDAIANADATLAANLTLSPKRVGAGTAVSKKLLLQSSIDFENWVRGQLQKAIAEAVDRAAIVGTGANDQPTGLLATSGLGSYAWQVGSAAWVNIVDQVAVLRAANSDLNKAAWLTDHTVRADWKKTPVVSGASNMIIERGFKPRQAMVDDLPFLDHTDVTTGKVALGDFSSLMVALWGGIQLTYDPFSLKKSGQIELYAETYADVGVRQPADFCIGDSGVTHAGSI